MIRNTFYVCFLSFFLASGALLAQESVREFGKNRLQYKSFDWRFYASDNFEVYYYDGGDQAAKFAIEFLEEEFERITDLLGYAPYAKSKVFLYNSITDIQQSNIGINEHPYTIGGQTTFVKLQVELAYPGSNADFKNQLLYGVTRMLLNDMMFGGSLSDIFQNSYLLSLPEWFIDGAAHYIAEGWTVEMDDYIRDLLRNGKVRKLNNMSQEEAVVVGHSIWNYISAQYGRSNISNVLNLTRIIRNEESSIASTLGIPFRQFYQNWKLYYQNMNVNMDESYEEHERDHRISKRNKKGVFYNRVRYSKDGKYLAYTENNLGRQRVTILDTETGKSKVAFRGGSRVINQEVDNNLPLIGWIDEFTLGIISVRRGKNFLWQYDVSSGKSAKKELGRFTQIHDFDVSSNGKLMVLSADVRGQNDLFLVSLRRNALKRLTNDVFDDLNPRFIPGTVSVVFSSNRSSDSLRAKNPKISDIGEYYSLYIYDLDNTEDRLVRLTKTLSQDLRPQPIDEYNILYLSDQKGIRNVYLYNLQDSLFSQSSRFFTSIDDYDYNRRTKDLAYVSHQDGARHIFIKPEFNYRQTYFTPQTLRQDVKQARMISERVKSRQQKESQERRKQSPSKQPVRQERLSIGQMRIDTLKITSQEDLDTEEYVFGLSDDDAELVTQPDEALSVEPDEVRSVEPDEVSSVETDEVRSVEPDDIVVISDEEMEDGAVSRDTVTLEEKDKDRQAARPRRTSEEPEDGTTDIIDTENYSFSRSISETRDQRSFLTNYRKMQRSSRIMGPIPYEPRFSADFMTNRFLIDPLRGFGMEINTQMNDMLGDHSFMGGLTPMYNIMNPSGDIFTEYRLLKYYLDFHVRYDRRSVNFDQQFEAAVNQKYILNRYEVGASLPFTSTTRLTVSPFYTTTRFLEKSIVSITSPPSEQTDQMRGYLGYQAELVFDNSIPKDVNIFSGTKAKISYNHHRSLVDEQLSFSNLNVEARHYQKIHREITLVMRGAYGKFMGNAPKNYLLGGMDNWVFARRNESGDDNPLNGAANFNNEALLFNQFVFNLRGFDHNRLFGTDVLVFNAELRLPLVKYFYRGPISNNFFRNLQFVGFYDIGSAWTEASPFNPDNEVNTVTHRGPGPFEATIRNFNNPWLSSYGVGARTVILNFYTKFDLAWPIENFEVGRPRFIVSLGYDF